MTSKTRSFRPSPAMIISCVAMFMALTGSAFAVGIAKNSVRSAQIVDGTVRTIDVRDNAVNAAKIATDAVGTDEIAENAVASPEVAQDSLTNQDLGAASVTSSEVADGSLGSADIADQSLTANDLAADSVGPSELQADSVRSAELATIVQVASSAPIKGGDNASASITCPAGTTVISGGGSSGFYQVHLASSYRSGNGWRIDARSAAVGDTTITAYAYCLAA
ncbi:MAG: hypothetical protein JJE35_13890 [Thermoleophilia bacterium]|nr:hypothetical protein [Thermoleophilia bacterium]